MKKNSKELREPVKKRLYLVNRSIFIYKKAVTTLYLLFKLTFQLLRPGLGSINFYHRLLYTQRRGQRGATGRGNST
jgi:hypothetical protein